MIKTKHLVNLLSVFVVVTLLIQCNSKKTEPGTINIIPKPVNVETGSGQFTLDKNTKIVLVEDNEEMQSLAAYLQSIAGPATGFDLQVGSNGSDGQNSIVLAVDPSLGKPEGYHLDVATNQVKITGGSTAGVFYGIQSMRQLLPVSIESQSPVSDVSWTIPVVKIEDYPRFPYRGLHLDVGRHFFPVSFIKKYLDLMALHKLNTFHWHLTEDQGWRIEIKKYPKLTEVGAYRDSTLIGHNGSRPVKYDHERYGGFYTQDEIRDVVAYAAKRHITIIPEIEMPGHSLAALAAYPELGCPGNGPYHVATHWGVFQDVYCAGNDQVFDFLEDVLTEVMDLFPSKYIHIGGDECPKTRWKNCPLCQARIKKLGLKDEHELQSYFIQRIEKFLNGHGRQIIGWDEILEGGLAPQATVMSWRGIQGGIDAAKMHHDVIMTPGAFLYFDHYQNDPKKEPLAIGGYLTLKKVYSYEPVPDALNADEAKYILGAQGNVWSEYMKDPDYVEYMVYPRACALAEVDWSPKDSRNWVDFAQRMDKHYGRLKALNVHYFYQIPEPLTEQNVVGFTDKADIVLHKVLPDTEIRYTIDGSDPDGNSSLYSGPVNVNADGILKAISYRPSNGDVSNATEITFNKLSYMDATNPGQIQKGLNYQYFEGDFNKTTDMDDQSPAKKGTISEITLPDDHRTEHFGYNYDGFIDVPTDGIYTFYLAADDGSILNINGETVIDHDGYQGSDTKIGQAALRKGLHPLHIAYFQGGGGAWINLQYEGPGIEKQPVPDEQLFRK